MISTTINHVLGSLAVVSRFIILPHPHIRDAHDALNSENPYWVRYDSQIAESINARDDR